MLRRANDQVDVAISRDLRFTWSGAKGPGVELQAGDTRRRRIEV